MATIQEHYARLRASHFSPYGARRFVYQQSAKSALQGARYCLEAEATREAWEALDGFEISEYDRHAKSEPGESLDCPGPIRLLIVADENCGLDDLLGDCFNPEVNSDIKAEILESEKQAYILRIERDGVCGVIGEYWNGGEWAHVDSCFGFVGDDWRESGYGDDIMGATLAAYNSHLESLAREIERQRPDMYQGVTL